MTAQFNPDVRYLYENIIKRNVIPRDEFDYMPQRYGAGRVREEALCGNDGHYPSISQIENSNFGGAYGRSEYPIQVGGARKCGGVGILKQARVEPFINEINEDYMPVSASHGAGRAPRLTKAMKERILAEHPMLMQHQMRGGKIDWKKIWQGIKDTASFVSKAAPIAAQIAGPEYADDINKVGNISGAISGMGRRKKAGSMAQMAAIDIARRMSKRKGAGFWQDFGKGLKQGLKTSSGIIAKAAPIGMMLAPELAPEIGAIGAISGATNKALGGRRKRMTLPKSGHKREVARGDIVAAIMKQRGVGLGEASRIVKQEGLY